MSQPLDASFPVKIRKDQKERLARLTRETGIGQSTIMRQLIDAAISAYDIAGALSSPMHILSSSEYQEYHRLRTEIAPRLARIEQKLQQLHDATPSIMAVAEPPSDYPKPRGPRKGPGENAKKPARKAPDPQQPPAAENQ